MRGLLVRAVCLGRTFVGPRLSMMNYRQLQDLHTRLSGKGLRILAFPCNQFGNQVLGSRLFTHRTQEPWPEAEIKRWVSEKFGVTFDMFSKIDVNGSNAHPLFKYLKKEQHGFLWNFGKFLVDRTGKPRKRYSPQTDPLHSPVKSQGFVSCERPLVHTGWYSSQLYLIGNLLVICGFTNVHREYLPATCGSA
ncbi:hypothetical protein CRM22_007347 [Opisthorchis felineus]|uniref:Glutathione peroxidase n=1 Tax=Opisthorchis felineus TaxID=147828 RepID=A0A4S2LGB3_OPIFE|nr:hypothetical protein CRM22_007347 [Opisthorchis felineus]